MLDTIVEPGNVQAENARLRDMLARSQAERARLLEENRGLLQDNRDLQQEIRDLRATLDAYIRRAQSTSLYGPLEMTAGTCVGPRRSCAQKHHG
jgi:uncharacterized protein YlxW (UPF0749 family)